MKAVLYDAFYEGCSDTLRGDTVELPVESLKEIDVTIYEELDVKTKNNKHYYCSSMEFI